MLATVLMAAIALPGVSPVAAAAGEAGRTYIVKQDGTGDFTTIQAAANVAQPGDTVLVYGGTYREEVVLPRGGTGEDARITLRAAEGEEVIVTGSDPVAPSEWQETEMPGVYKMVKPNSYFPGHREDRGDRLPGWTSDLDQFNPFNSFWRSRANSSTPSSGSGADQKLGYVSCGQVYLNGEPMNQRWSLNGEADGITNATFGTVAGTPGTWIAYVDVIDDGENPITTSPNGNPDMEGDTTIYVNFGDVDPRDAEVDTEINVRMQCITAEWNLGYITVDGFTVMRGAGPKTVDFWQIRAEGMFGAISTNGGYYWVIENCDVTQCRGVGVDFGNGSRGQEERYGPGYRYGDYESSHTVDGLPAYNGNGPELYGYHTIRDCNLFDNATNAMFAYRGAYTEIYGCSFVNNNAINTGLASEAYFKNVSGGFGINLHDNYFYSDQTWTTRAIWMDCENDNAIVANNVVYTPTRGRGFSTIDYELNAGWNLFANNILVNVNNINNGVNGNLNVMNNLLINSGTFNVIGSASQGRAGAEGGASNADTITPYNGITTNPTSARNRTNRVVAPGTLNEITTVGNPTSRFDGYSRFNKYMGNMVFNTNASNTSGTQYTGDDRVTGYGEFVLKREDECEPGHVSMPDFSGGVASFHAGLPDVVALQQAGTIFDWTWVYAAGEAGNKPISRTVYGNEADWNVYYGVSTRPSAWESRGFEEKSVVVPDSEGNSYVITADKDSFSIALNVDDSAITVNPPLFTSEFMGPSDMLLNLGYTSYPPSVTHDILGNVRNAENNVAGPFADLKAGYNVYQLWPQKDKVYALTSPVKTIVAGCAANIPADISFAGEAVPFDLGLYNPDGALIDTLRVTADGRYTFKITTSDTAKAGAYVIKAVGAASGCVIDCVAQPDDLWAPTVADGESSVTVVFASDVSFNAAKKSVKIDGVAVNNIKVSVSGKVMTIADTTVTAGQSIVIAGVKYADLFPSYSFTFTLKMP